jgi:DNA-binding beta-propeller fold protein YncE
VKKILLGLLLAAAFAGAAQARALYRLTASIPIAGADTWDYLVFDQPSDRLYISHGDQVTVVDGKTWHAVGALTGLPGSHGIAVDPRTGLVYADSAGRGLLVWFDPKTFQPLGSAKVPPDADGVNYDSFSRQIYVSGGDSDGLTPVSTVTGQAAPTIALGASPEFHVADGKGSEYVDLADADQIARIDSLTNKITARWPLGPCRRPKGLAIDPASRRLFATCANGLAVVVDADRGDLLAVLPIGKGSDAARYDKAQDWFLSSNGDGTLTVVAPHGPDGFAALGNVKTALGARTMAVDPRTGRVFLVTATVTGTIPPKTAGDHAHYVFAPGSFTLLVFDPVR